LESEEIADIRVVKDPLPVVRLLKPGATAEFTPDAEVPFKFLVSDEKFAVRSVFVEYRRKAQDGKDLDDNAMAVTLFDAATNGKLIPWQIAQATGLSSAPPDLRLRRPKLAFDMLWSLKNKFKPGEVVVLEVGALDFCNITPKREGEAGRSHQIELRIISKNQLLADIDRKLGQIQQDLQRAAKLEKKAIDAVQQTRKEKKIDQTVKDKFNDNADQPQKDVRDIIGKDSTDGLRGDLAKLRQTLKANKLENTQAFRDAGELKGALDNIAQEELQQLEPKLQQIRSELNHNEKNNPQIQKKLDEAAKLQGNVAKTLDELVGKMDPTAKAREQRVEIRDIIAKEQQLRDDLAKLNADKQKDSADAPETVKESVEKEYKQKVQQKAEEQKELANRLEKLVKEMKAEQKNQEKLGHKEEAKKIDDALKQIEQPKNAKPRPMQEENKLPINAQMKKVADDLKNKSETPENALKQQQDIAKDLEKALDALEGKNPDMARQEIQNRKQAEKKIDQHARELKKLQEKEKDIDKIQNMEERLKKKQELAQEFAELQEKMEKTRRQLAQLQEQQAANALKEAIKNVENAEQKAQQGQNGQEDEQKAQEKLREAKNKVREAEEELAREMLIRMADQLKGLKERQDASLKRTEDLHPKVMRLKSWTDALLDTMEGNLDAQKSITEETDDLKKKLDGAVVFKGILERAKKSMDDAGNVMENRHKEGKDRRYVVDGKKMDEMEVKDETEWQTDTVRFQKQAARSLTNLLDSLKEEIEKKKKPQVAQNDEKQPDNEEKQPKGGVPQQDGIPPTAQLKALKAEQLDLNERTTDFDKRNPDPNKLDDRQRAELRELEREQERLQELFQQLTAQPPALPKEGDMP
ncbi:MAG TPA: hypothetical protein VFE62_27295, partial [Gemmataceae bacterium]|nr:hypothetical protein [Gemmataceae bacterium]